ncbi:MAG TPA: PPC domain-containing DNA-binding protein [Dehalococcoidia bacterium]|nr:PPC domain-containing DNA-binding protein [Dehalococcoidia bacterium]
MRGKLLSGGKARTYAIVFDKGDEFVAGIKRFAEENGLDAAHFTAIGAFSRMTLEYFNRQKMAYDKIPLDQQVEVLSLIGNIAGEEDGLKVHAHTVVGLPDGTTRGGHIGEAHVWPTLEVMLDEGSGELKRKKDPETGLTLLDI